MTDRNDEQQQPLLRGRVPARKMLGLAAAGMLGLTATAVWKAQSHVGSAPGALLSWDPAHLVPEQRKIEREMRNEIAKGGMVNVHDKAVISGQEHNVEALATKATQDEFVLHTSAADKALADADDVLDGAPDVIKSVLGARAPPHRGQAANALSTIDKEAREDYKDSLEGYERMEEGMAPVEPTEKVADMEREREVENDHMARKDRSVLEQRFRAPGTKQQLEKTSPAVVKQMMWDLQHPPPEQRKIEREMNNQIAQPGKSSAADKTLIASLEHKVQSLETLNGKIALTQAPPGKSTQAMEHAEKVAAQAARSEEKQALSYTTLLVPNGPQSAALLHSEAVARTAAAKEVKQEELATKKFLKTKVNVDKLRVLGVKEDHMGGVRTALVAGQKSAKKIPGVKEDTWPFAPGSFHYARKHPLPGVNEASWEIIPDFEGPKDAAKGFKAHAGGCFPDGKGGLKCHGEQEKWMKNVKGWDKKGALPKKAPGTSLAMLLPHIREDAKQQKLEAAAEAFGDSMAQEIPARTQSLEQVSTQCSNFLDCLAMQGTVVPQYTHPKYGAEEDEIVRTQAQSLSHTAMHDAFNPELRPWRLISKWPFESGDVQVKMPKDYIGKISRMSVKSHHKSHMKYDVPAAELPSDRLTSMYANERKELKGQALAAEKAGTELMQLWETSPVGNHQEQLKAQMLAVEADPKPEPKNNPVKPGARHLGVRNYENTLGLCTKGINCDSSNWPFGEEDSMSDALVDASRVQDGGLGTVGPWTPMMYTGNKPTSYDPGAAYIPDYQFLANRRRSAGFPTPKSQMLRLSQMRPMMDELQVEPESAVEDDEGPLECPVCETCEEGDDECLEANAECLAAAEECNAAAEEETCGECEEDDAQCEEAKVACEAEAECLEGDNECIAAARGGFWSPMTGHIEKNVKEFEHNPRPQHQGKHAWNLPGVKVDSGWSPYKHADVWGYDRRLGAKSPDPEQGGEDENVEANSQTGLLSAAQDLPKEQWNALDEMEHSDHTRAIGSLAHAWHSVVGGEEEKPESEHEEAVEEAEAPAEVDEEGFEQEPAYDFEKGPMYEAEGGEEMSTESKVYLLKHAPALRQKDPEEMDGRGLKMEREAEAERDSSLKEQQQLDQYLHARSEMGGVKTEELVEKASAGRKLLSAQNPNVEPKDDDTLNVKFPARPKASDGDGPATVMPRRARGKGKHGRGMAKPGLKVPNTEKMVADLRKVRSEGQKLGEGPWGLAYGTDKVVRSIVRHAGDDIRGLMGMGSVHAGKSAKERDSLKSAKHLNMGGHSDKKIEDPKDADSAKMSDLNALTADVDQVTNSDDIADMRGVDAKLHTLVDNLRQRRASRPV